jgi:hypothetical protein
VTAPSVDIVELLRVLAESVARARLARAEYIAAREAACEYPFGCEWAHEMCDGCWNA